MANKVLSIKMDENDIERLKKYYKALVDTGFLPAETMSLNAFYKHLLLDYLEDDVNRAFATFSDYGISPRCLNPEKLGDGKGSTLVNIYNLSAEMFEVYEQCAKEVLNRTIDEMEKNAEIFNEVVNSEVIVTEGWLRELKCISSMDMNEKNTSFWGERAYEIVDLQERDFKKNEIDGEIEMIEKSSMSEELKQNLINEINEYEKKRKQNYNIIQGRGIIQ